MDLDLEHSNKFFKENFRLSRGEPTEAVLHHLSKSQDIAEMVVHSFKHENQTTHFNKQHAMDVKKYDADVGKVSSLLRQVGIYNKLPGCHYYSVKMDYAGRNILHSVDTF